MDEQTDGSGALAAREEQTAVEASGGPQGAGGAGARLALQPTGGWGVSSH